MTVTDHEYLKKILLAPVYDVAVNSDLVLLSRLTAELGNDVFLKREDQQPVKSFKLRGAYNRIASLSPEQLDAGVIAASAGNHAQGVAYSANMKGINATIVMPETTPDIKIEAVRRFGGQHANVVLHGTNFDTASAHGANVHPIDKFSGLDCGIFNHVAEQHIQECGAGRGTIAEGHECHVGRGKDRVISVG